MFKWPMRGHFRYLRFKTFSMTSRTPQCKVFWALLSNSKHSGVSEDSKSPTLGVLGFTPTLGQSEVATSLVACIFAMYSISVVDKTIVGYRLLFQEMVPPPIMNTNLVVDFLSSRSLAQSTSQYLTKFWGGNPLKRNLNCKVPYKY
jgi:hypothetical protein